MEIGPIRGIRVLGSVKTRSVDLQAPVVFDIDGSAKPGDAIVQTSAKKAAGAEEDGEDDLAAERELDEDGGRKGVDCFA